MYYVLCSYILLENLKCFSSTSASDQTDHSIQRGGSNQTEFDKMNFRFRHIVSAVHKKEFI